MICLNRLVGLLCLSLILSATMQAQSFDTTVGGSQIYNAYGLQTQFKWHSMSGWTGLGYNDGLKVGAYVEVPLARDYRLGAGDQILSGYLDVDPYDTHTFTVRGVSLTRETKTESFQMFSGLLSQESQYPFLHISSTVGTGLTETRLIAMLFTHKFSDALRLHAMTLYGDKVTSIESVGWTPSKKWGLAGAAGIGSGAKYFAAKGELHLKKVEAQTSFTIAGQSFHRQEGPYSNSEPLGLNAKIKVDPFASVKLQLDHEKSRMFMLAMPSVVANIDSASLYASFKGLQLSPSVSAVKTSNIPGQTITEMFSASRRILPRWRAFGSYIDMKSPTLKQSTIIATNEFKISPRLAIRQNFNRMNGQDNFSFGGEWLSNRLSFSVDQQVYISPLAAAFGAKSLFQAWTFNVRVRTPHGTSTNINTFVSPDGRMQWGGYLSGLRYHSLVPLTDESPSFSKYVISGLVVDETGKGVWGIAIQIGSETVISDSDGSFFVHVKNSKLQPVSVLPESSLQTSRWSLISAPPTAKGFLEDKSGDPVRVVVQMARRVVAQNSAPTLTAEPQRPAESFSSSVQPPAFQMAKAVVPPKLNDALTIEPQPMPDAIDVSKKPSELLISRRFKVQKGAGIVDYEIPQRTSDISATAQADQLQSAVSALRAAPLPRPAKQLKEQRPRKPGKVLEVLRRIICFQWFGHSHARSMYVSEETPLNLRSPVISISSTQTRLGSAASPG